MIPESGEGGKVLLVDDDPYARATLSAHLRGRGFDVRCAGDGPSAIEAYRLDPVDIVLLDIQMPTMHGVDVCRALKELAGEDLLPVLFLTGSTDMEETLHVLGEGEDLCAKSVSLPELEARMRTLLRLKNRDRRLRDESRKLKKIAVVDVLTGLVNRRGFEDELERTWARAERGGGPFALLLADIDRFKAVNDRFGHPAGDAVLRRVARLIQGAIRRGDQAFRIGGEEFAVVAPGASRAVTVAERIRGAVAAEPFSDLPEATALTLSLGVAIGPGDRIRSARELLGAADQALYDAKATGRNRIACALPLACDSFANS
jgi:diguanylate cyclase (GGDEF)-like protein